MKTHWFDSIILLLVIIVGAIQLFTPHTSTISPIISAATLLILTVSAVYFILRIINSSRVSKQYSITHDTNEEVVDESVFNYITNRYGVGYRSIMSECVINEDGSAIITRSIELIAESDIGYLDTSLNIPTEKDGSWDFEMLQVYSTTPNRDVSVNKKLILDNVQSAQLVFSPPLRPKDVVRYVLREKLPKDFYSFAKSLEELKEMRKSDEFTGLNDYFGWHVNRPTRYLKLKVTFPANWEPRIIESKVLVARSSGFPSTIEQREENRRIKFDLVGPYNLELEAHYPMIGLIYVASWQPILSSERRGPSGNIESDATVAVSSR